MVCTLRPCLHGYGQISARTKTCTVPPCVHTGPAELDEFFNGKVRKFGTWKKQVNFFTGTVPISYGLQVFAQFASFECKYRIAPCSFFFKLFLQLQLPLFCYFAIHLILFKLNLFWMRSSLRRNLGGICPFRCTSQKTFSSGLRTCFSLWSSQRLRLLFWM